MLKVDVKAGLMLTGICLLTLAGCGNEQKNKKDGAEAIATTDQGADASDDATSDGGKKVVDSMLATAILDTPSGSLPYGIKTIKAQGTGCPAGKVGVDLSNNDRLLTLIFDEFVVTAEAGATAKTAEKACELEVEIQPPAGHAVAVFNQNLLGYSNLDAKGHGEFTSEFRFSNLPRSVNLKHQFNFHGPYDNSFEFFNRTSPLWAPCEPNNRTVKLLAKTTLKAIADAGGYAYLALDTQDAELEAGMALTDDLAVELNLDFVPCTVMPGPIPPTPTPVPPTPTNPDELVCESSGYVYNSCRVAGKIASIELLKQYSHDECKFGDTYGFYHDRIWVDRGCIGLFKYILDRRPPTPVPPMVSELKCESHVYKYNLCEAQRIVSAVLVAQHSAERCLHGINWGVEKGKGLWVDKGCRGTFYVNLETVENPPIGYYEDLRCESSNYGEKNCSVGIVAKNVEILEQYSSSACVKNQDFGLLNTGTIWVKNGCQGRFRVYDF